MSLWIIATLAAAGFQTVRFMLQKSLASGTLSVAGATFARFLYSAPLVAVLLVAYLLGSGTALPPLSGAFWIYGAIGGASQILATICVVALFKTRNFAVGTTLAKTEVIQSVLVGVLVLGERVSWAAFGFILIGTLGVVLLSDPPGSVGRFFSRILNKAAGFGLASGVLFAVSGVCYRAASLELSTDLPLLRAGITLAAVTMMQMLAMAIWLRRFQPEEIARVWQARRTAGFVGLTSMAGSFCWFTAFTLQTAAYVKAVGQVEVALSLLAAVLFFHETITRREYIGIAVLCVSVLGLVLVV